MNSTTATAMAIGPMDENRSMRSSPPAAGASAAWAKAEELIATIAAPAKAICPS
jgi:hypothetical protein